MQNLTLIVPEQLYRYLHSRPYSHEDDVTCFKYAFTYSQRISVEIYISTHVTVKSHEKC